MCERRQPHVAATDAGATAATAAELESTATADAEWRDGGDGSDSDNWGEWNKELCHTETPKTVSPLPAFLERHSSAAKVIMALQDDLVPVGNPVGLYDYWRNKQVRLHESFKNILHWDVEAMVSYSTPRWYRPQGVGEKVEPQASTSRGARSLSTSAPLEGCWRTR